MRREPRASDIAARGSPFDGNAAGALLSAPAASASCGTTRAVSPRGPPRPAVRARAPDSPRCPGRRPACGPARARAPRPSARSGASPRARQPRASRRAGGGRARAAICGRWVMTKTWWHSATRRRFAATRLAVTSADAGIDLIEHQGRHLVQSREDGLEREHHAGKLAARGDAGERPRLEADVERDAELDRFRARRADLGERVERDLEAAAPARARAGCRPPPRPAAQPRPRAARTARRQGAPAPPAPPPPLSRGRGGRARLRSRTSSSSRARRPVAITSASVGPYLVRSRKSRSCLRRISSRRAGSCSMRAAYSPMRRPSSSSV